MNTNTPLFGLIRTVLAFLAGTLVTKGKLDAQNAETLTGAATSIIVAGWSVLAKKQEQEKKKP